MTSAKNFTRSRLPAKRVLEGAKKHASKDVIVISQAKDGGLYLASSMPNNSPEALQAQIKLVSQALKDLRRYHRNATRQEDSNDRAE